ncbi:MAG: zinc ABC transporter substrate-binding protein [Thermofilaceae archaeon]
MLPSRRVTESLNRKLIYLAVAIAVLTAVTLLLGASIPDQYGRKKGLQIAVTFPSLAFDIEQLLCEGDTVLPLIPPGVDPHEYQLTPSDIGILKESDLIVSTAHASFENRIAELHLKGELKGALIEVPRVPGMNLKVNPATGVENPHWPIYDPENYIAFIRYIARVMSEKRPQCSYIYTYKADEIESRVREIVATTKPLNVSAIAVSPIVQYAVEWVGIKVDYLLTTEHELPTIPENLVKVEAALSASKASLIISIKGIEDTPLGRKAAELASRYGRAILYVDSPLALNSTLTKLEDLCKELLRLHSHGG